jgi:hypothetical protein
MVWRAMINSLPAWIVSLELNGTAWEITDLAGKDNFSEPTHLP